MSVDLSITSCLRTLLPLVPVKERLRFIALCGLSIVVALTEIALAGMLALMAAVFGSPEAVQNNNPLRWLRETLDIGFVEDPRLLAFYVLCAIFLFVVSRNILTIVQQRQTAMFSESVGIAARAHLSRFFSTRAVFMDNA